MAAVGVVGMVAMFTTPVLSAYQQARLTAFLDPSLDPEGIGYQTREVRIAIGQGGWFGQGLFQGPQTQSGAIPFQQTDFVFSVAGRSGGSSARRGSSCSWSSSSCAPCWWGRAVTRSGELVCVGVAVWFAVQAFENIGMNLGIMPVTGCRCRSSRTAARRCSPRGLALGLVNNVHLAGTARRR